MSWSDRTIAFNCTGMHGCLFPPFLLPTHKYLKTFTIRYFKKKCVHLVVLQKNAPLLQTNRTVILHCCNLIRVHSPHRPIYLYTCLLIFYLFLRIKICSRPFLEPPGCYNPEKELHQKRGPLIICDLPVSFPPLTTLLSYSTIEILCIVFPICDAALYFPTACQYFFLRICQQGLPTHSNAAQLHILLGNILLINIFIQQ